MPMIRKPPFGRIVLWAAAVCGVVCASIHGEPAGSTVVFKQEHIKVFVGANKIRIEGIYTFANSDSFPRRQGLYYPFPIDSLHPSVESIVVRSGGDTIPFSRTGNGISFVVFVPANGSAPYEVSYEQTCLDDSGCYILTSTAAWDVPLDRANFEIHVPNTLVLDWVSYDIDKITKGSDSHVHEFSRTDFMPDQDLCLRWHAR